MGARVVFDLDGTLIDSAPDIHAIANGILASEGAAPITFEQARSFIGNGVSVFVEKMCAATGIPVSRHERLLAEFVRRYDDAVHLTRPYPGVREALTQLGNAGHHLGICTNKPIRPCLSVLQHLNLDSFFMTVIGGDSLALRKPDPAPLEAAFIGLPDGPEIYVGDSEVDAETAHRASVPFLLFSGGYRKAPVEKLPHTAVFHKYQDMPNLLETVCRDG